jgi:type IV pilus assembly protein PilW
MKTTMAIDPPRRGAPVRRRAMRGFSLIELMISITIGLMILAALTAVFVNSSNANREMRNSSEQIENGRFAIELITEDVRHAGFYGRLSTLPAVPATAPDPCAAPTAGAVSDTVNAGLALPVQRVSSSSIPSGCNTLLTAANLAPNSDIIVVRRTSTTPLKITCTNAATVAAGVVYLQTIPSAAEMQFAVAGSVDSTKNVTGAAYSATMVTRDQTVTAGTTAGTCAAAVAGQFPLITATMWPYFVHIYFVAPCSVPNGGGSVCTGSADDQGKPIPTLKRLEMGANGAFSIVPLVEGIQAIRAEYGVDNTPATADPGTGLVGDGIPDTFTNTPSVADSGNTVAMRVFVLARNTRTSSGYVDDKTYTLGTYTTTAANDGYKRHVYSAETRISNQAGRREIPQ